jgi:hypothetical protein
LSDAGELARRSVGNWLLLATRLLLLTESLKHFRDWANHLVVRKLQELVLTETS